MSTIDEVGLQIIKMFKNINWSPILPQIEMVITTSIDRNFSENGRYGSQKYGGGSSKWKLSQRVVKHGGQTLSKSGQLADSIRVSVTQSDGAITVEIGSNKVYATVHQFGYSSKNIDPRPYLVIQDEDLEEIRKIIADYLNNYFN